MNDDFASLLRHPAFREGEAWQRLRLQANDYIFREGDEATAVYVILGGNVRIIADLELEEGRHIHPGFCDLAAGEVFGELALFDRQLRSASVMAISDCELAQLPNDVLLDFLDAHPDIGYQVLKAITGSLIGRLRSTNRKLFSILAWGLKAHGLEQHL